MNPNAAYWNDLAASRGAPQATGAADLMELQDVRVWLEATGFRITGKVLDIGCGTGRVAALCDRYVGVDIAKPMVDYARAAGLDARLIEGPADLPDEWFDRIVAFSVFTHIDRQERQDYLREMRRRLRSGCEALVDILPGAEGGTAGQWWADPAAFEQDVRAAGFEIKATCDWLAAGGIPHRYYRLV